MEEKKLYIEREDPAGTLYERLQRSTLDELQRLSGKVWTDYNPGDPGVTTADIANYALTELDYKLGFDLRDYLTDENGKFDPERYGLFLPEAVYPTTPVTAEDYCKLLLSEFPEIENAEVRVKDASSGFYSITLYLSPFGENAADLRSRVFAFFHSHRNLCENLREEDILIHDYASAKDELSLFSEVELEEGADPVPVLTQLYWKAMRYFAGSVSIRRLDRTDGTGDISLEDWMDGVGRDTGVDIPRQENTQQELYAKLCDTEGVKAFKTCYFVKGNTEENPEDLKIVSSFSGKNSLYIPKNRRELKVRLYAGGTELPVDMERFLAGLQSLYLARKDQQPNNRPGDDAAAFSRQSLKAGVYRDVWNHSPVCRDFPLFYRSEMKKNRSPENVPGVFEVYLGLFDRIMERGLEETRQLKDILTIGSSASTSIRVCKDGEADDEIGKRNIFALKNRYMDFLDNLYGVDSSPAKVDGVAWYDTTQEQEMARRMRFLRSVPELTECRSKAFDIYGECDGRNLAVIKKHISLLFGLNMDEGRSVGNVLPDNNIFLVDDSEEEKRIRERLNPDREVEKLLATRQVERIPLREPVLTREERKAKYESMRQKLRIFNPNRLCGGLFREGMYIRHYRLITIKESEYLLVFHNEEEDYWVDLGRFGSKERPVEVANLLRRYLLDLNRRCEAVYVLEHSLFVPSEKHPDLTREPFKVSFVLPDWTSRFHSDRFIHALDKVISRLLPAHLGYDILRLDEQRIRRFEAAFLKWRKALARRAPEAEVRACQDAMLSELTDTERT